MLARVTRSGTMSTSFKLAHEDLWHTGELKISTKHVQRLTERTGRELLKQREEEAQAFEKLTLPERRQSLGVAPPQVAVVQADGGRMQILERDVGSPLEGTATMASSAAKEPASHWRESKVGTLLSVESETQSTDPAPQVPDAFLDPRYVSKLAREIGHASGETRSTEALASGADKSAAETPVEPRPGLPKIRKRSLVATLRGVEEFALLLAAAAWKLGFHAALRKAFLADGSSTMWTVWRMYFSHYVPIVDFVHALTYVFAAAMAGRSAAEGWQVYVRWIQWLWEGEVKQVIEELKIRQAELRESAATADTSPYCIVTTSLTYLENQQSRMKYAEYRCQGLPITTCHVESAVKQIGRRVKGSEKFWSRSGGEALLALRAAYLSDPQPMVQFWQNRQANASGQREYCLAV